MIERFVYGMFDGKIVLYKTQGLNKILSDKNFQILRNLGVEYDGQYFWLPTEQVVALPWITKVDDDDGREFIQNRTLIVPIHDYLQLTNVNTCLTRFFDCEWDNDNLEPIEVEPT